MAYKYFPYPSDPKPAPATKPTSAKKRRWVLKVKAATGMMPVAALFGWRPKLEQLAPL
jgi:hypothetical protein